MKTLFLLFTLLQTPTATELESKADSAKAVIGQFANGMQKNPTGTLHNLGQDAIQFGLKVLAALVIYFVGAWLIRRIKFILNRRFTRKKTEKALASFISSFVTISLTVILLIITIGTLGVNTSSLAALLAAGGVAIGMALSGTVQNFAGGIMIMAFKPFKAGDLIEAQGFQGIVTGVSIVNTTLTTYDNRSIIIPNGTLFNGNIDNHSRNSLRRVEWKIGVAYGTNVKACQEKLKEIVKSDDRILDSSTKGAKDPFVAISELAASSVVFLVWAWAKTDNYWNVYFDINNRIYAELPEAGISFPYPQMDVHLYDTKAIMPDIARKE
jgi:small conductance mechanosensitive channel